MARTRRGSLRVRVAAYVRVSTAEQSCDLQRRELEAYCQARGWIEVTWFEDTGSGTTAERPALKRLLQAAHRRSVDVVLIWKLDRLFRSLKHLVVVISDWEALGVRLVSVRDQIDLTTPSGRLLVQLLGSFAEFEAGLIRERVRAGLAAAKAKGKRLGRPPRTLDASALLALRAQGLSIRAIATRTGVSPTLVYRAVSKSPGAAVPERPARVRVFR